MSVDSINRDAYCGRLLFCLVCSLWISHPSVFFPEQFKASAHLPHQNDFKSCTPEQLLHQACCKPVCSLPSLNLLSGTLSLHDTKVLYKKVSKAHIVEFSIILCFKHSVPSEGNAVIFLKKMVFFWPDVNYRVHML